MSKWEKVATDFDLKMKGRRPSGDAGSDGPRTPLRAFSIAAHRCQSNGRCPTRALIRVDTEALLEVLGSVDPRSPNPRRNTSNGSVEGLRSGDKAATCFLFVSTLSPLLGAYPQKADTKRKQGGYVSPLSNDLTSTFRR